MKGRVRAVLLASVTGVLAPFDVSALEPCSDHYRSVERAADNWAPRSPVLSIHLQGGFEPETVVRIAEGRVFVIRFRSPIWRTINGEFLADSKVRARVNSAPISGEVGDTLADAVTRAVNLAQPADQVGIDGYTLTFVVPSGCGEAWAPRPYTEDARLEQLFVLLVKHASSFKWQLGRSEKALKSWAEGEDKSPVRPNTSPERTRER